MQVLTSGAQPALNVENSVVWLLWGENFSLSICSSDRLLSGIQEDTSIPTTATTAVTTTAVAAAQIYFLASRRMPRRIDCLAAGFAAGCADLYSASRRMPRRIDFLAAGFTAGCADLFFGFETHASSY